ncbi:MAG: ATP-dependent Clp protease proteolytic subunit [Candidatus Hydrogenedentes bacterium]|nr:ATP-dependent Clp protease proteolytic subunit [Candidatus Hydrogenedentota bacterium]
MAMECPEKKDDEQKKDGMAGYLLKTRTIVLSGEVDQELAERVISQLFVLDNDNREPIRVVITSQGGHVDSGFAIHDVMRYVESPVYSIGAGWVASIAVPILFGAKKKENRLALPNTRFLLHQPSGGAGGQLQDIRIEAQEIMRIRQRINKLISDETGQSLDKVAKDSDRNFWMSAEEAVKYGIISRIVNNAKEIAK